MFSIVSRYLQKSVARSLSSSWVSLTASKAQVLAIKLISIAASEDSKILEFACKFNRLRRRRITSDE